MFVWLHEPDGLGACFMLDVFFLVNGNKGGSLLLVEATRTCV